MLDYSESVAIPLISVSIKVIMLKVIQLHLWQNEGQNLKKEKKPLINDFNN